MLTLSSYISGVRDGSIDPRQTLAQYQEKAQRNELNARISYTPEYVAGHVDDFLAKPLCAAPIGVKDIIMTKGEVTTCGSRMLENYVPEYSATCFLNLEEAGGLMIGKNTMDEFAMGGSGENCAFGPTKNPRDHTRISGGSSSGSAAAVAHGECLGALGTDTGGSVRLPAAFCGVVGFKPTYGAVSRYGVQAMAHSLDQVGVFGSTVDDARILFDAIAGYDPMDMSSMVLQSTQATQGPLKVAVLNSFFGQGVDSIIQEKTLHAIEVLKDSDAIACVDFVNFDLLQHLVAVYYIIMPAEASTNLARFDGLRYGLQSDTQLFDSLQEYYKYIRSKGFGPEVKRRLLLGSYVLSSGYQDQYYNKAVGIRDMVKQQFIQLFEQYDVVVGPTSPVWPWKIGGHANDPLSDYLADLYTIPANLIGAPAMSVPMGFGGLDGIKLPLGMHIMAKPGDDNKVFQMGKIVEQLHFS